MICKISKVSKVLSVSLMTALLLPSSVFAEQSASVFGVAQYDKQADLGLGIFGNDDATYFGTKLFNNPSWNSVKSKFNADVTTTAFVNGKYDDLVYFTGHGSSNGSLALKAYAGSNQPAGSYVNWDTIGSNWKGWDSASDDSDDFEFAIFMACDVLQRNSWGKVLASGGHHIFGYQTVSSENKDKSVIGDFYSKATGSSGQTPVKMIDAWRYANTTYGEAGWTVTGHKGNENDYFYVSAGTTPDISGTSDMYSWYSGGGFYISVPALKVATQNEMSEKILVTKENLKIEEIKQNLLGSNNSKSLSVEKDNGVYTNGKANLITYPSGALTYYREMSNKKLDITQDEAVSKANDFVKSNGGLPEDAQLTTISPQYSQPDSSKKEVPNGYLLEYKRVHNGVSVNGYVGDSIKVMVDSEGVNYYFRLWREINNEQSVSDLSTNKANILIDQNKAKEIGEKYLKDTLKGADGSAIKSDEVKLVYFSAPFTSTQNELFPAWQIDAKNQSAFVNASTGEVIDAEKLIDEQFEEMEKRMETTIPVFHEKSQK